MAWERVTTPFEKYVFHYLPGIPVLIGLCIISGYDDIETIGCAIRKLHLASNETLLGFTFFLILLIMVLFTVFLLAMMVDAVRHMFEYAFLTPKWTEYWIARHIQDGDPNIKDLERKLDIITKFHETEYFYTEFFGNGAFALFFLWGVMYWYGKTTNLPGDYFFIFLMHIVFIARAVSAQFIWKRQNAVAKNRGWNRRKRENIEKDHHRRNRRRSNHLENLRLRAMDFWATILFIVLMVIFGLYWLCIGVCIQVAHYYFIMTLVITSSFEVYIVRFRRFEETLKGGILPERDRYQYW